MTTVRGAVADDADQIRALLERFGYASASLSHVPQRLTARASNCHVHVAERGGVVVGVASLTVFNVLERAEPQARVSVIVVLPEARASGVALSLVRELERRAVDLGCLRVELTSADFLTGAHAFWQAAGYERTGLRFARQLAPAPAWPHHPIE